MTRPSALDARCWGGRPRGARIGWLAPLLLCLACGAAAEVKERLGGAAEDADATPAAVTATAMEGGLDGALAQTLPLAVRRRSINEAVFEVDSFVVALLKQHLGRGGDPSFERRDDGYVLKDIKEGGLAFALGLRAGDRVQALDGVSLADAAAARAALERLDGGASLTILRDDVTVTHEYLFVDGLAWATARGDEDAVARPPDEVPDLSVAMAAEPDPFAEAEARAGRGRSPNTGASRSGSSRGAGKPTGGSGGSNSGSSGSSGSSRGASKGGSSGGATTTATCAGSGSCTLSRSEFKRYLDNPSSLSREADVTRVGQGYKLHGVRSGGAVDRLGLQNGDIITSINGHKLADDADAMALYFGLGGTNTFRIQYLRGGRPRSTTVRLR